MRLIYYEGFMGALFFWLYRGCIRDIKRKYPRLEIERRHWADRREIHDDRAIVIGHSFGAHAAIQNVKVAKLLITLDPRWFGHQEYVRPSGVRHHNLYQPHGLHGYPVHFAENHFYGDETHLSIVRNAYIFTIIDEVMSR